MPFFHAHGISSVFRAFDCKKSIYLYSARLPLTKNNLLAVMQKHNFEIFYGVPYALKLLGESEEGMSCLAKMQVVMFGGSACPDSLGNRLVEADVNLVRYVNFCPLNPREIQQKLILIRRAAITERMFTHLVCLT